MYRRPPPFNISPLKYYLLNNRMGLKAGLRLLQTHFSVGLTKSVEV
jgi:hypothetical protein